MKFIGFLVSALALVLTIDCAAVEPIPNLIYPVGYKFELGKETIFKFLFETLEVDTGNMTFECRYDVVVKPGRKSNEVVVAIENVDVKTDSDRSADEEADAMQMPLLVTLDPDGLWSKVMLNPNETEFSLLMKNILLEHLVFNSTEIQEHANSTRTEEPDFIMDGTPLGSCKMDINVNRNPGQVELHYSSTLENCEGDTDFSLSDTDEASLNSTIDWKLGFTKRPLTFKKSELNVNYTLTTSDSHVMYHQSLEFVKLRPTVTCIDISDLTESYTPDSLSEKLQSNGQFSVDQL